MVSSTVKLRLRTPRVKSFIVRCWWVVDGGSLTSTEPTFWVDRSGRNNQPCCVTRMKVAATFNTSSSTIEYSEWGVTTLLHEVSYGTSRHTSGTSPRPAVTEHRGEGLPDTSDSREATWGVENASCGRVNDGLTVVCLGDHHEHWAIVVHLDIT